VQAEEEEELMLAGEQAATVAPLRLVPRMVDLQVQSQEEDYSSEVASVEVLAAKARLEATFPSLS
jgi:hypothetical protein